jgi:fimbrial chaperone protein
MQEGGGQCPFLEGPGMRPCLAFVLKLVICLFLSLCLVFVPQLNASFSISPQIITLEPTGRKSEQWLIIRHMGDMDSPMAIELRIVKRELDISGRVFHATDDTDENFVLYPAQMILFPGEVQTVYVQWAGDPALGKEIEYSLIAEEVPIKLNPAGNNHEKKDNVRLEVRTLVRYEGLIVVRPSKVAPDIVVESANVEIDEAGKPHLIVVVYNRGSARQKLGGMSLTVTPVEGGNALVDKAVTFKPQLPRGSTTHSLYAGYRRRCDLPWPESIRVGPVQVFVTFE